MPCAVSRVVYLAEVRQSSLPLTSDTPREVVGHPAHPLSFLDPRRSEPRPAPARATTPRRPASSQSVGHQAGTRSHARGAARRSAQQ